MVEKIPLSQEEISEMVRGIAPPDWQQIALLRNLPMERRIIPAMRAQAFALSTYRATLKRRYPNLAESELNMKTLAHFTEVRLSRR